MASRPLVSIVVPIFNVEAFLPKCVDSIRSQTLREIEIILVDDGSPDHCGELADRFALEDRRIKVVHRENGGLGPARNSGIEAASGDYIGFVDSDDWVEPEMFERLYVAAERVNAQVAYTGMKTVCCGEVIHMAEHPYAGQTLRGAEEIFRIRRAFYGARPARIKHDPVLISACVAIYKREMLENNHLRFKDVRSEDKPFNIIACRASDVVVCVSSTPYCYRKDNQDSITKVFNRDTVESFFDLFSLLEELANDEEVCFLSESRIRTSRCVVDYSRALIAMIEGSSESSDIKQARISEVCSHPALQKACKGYPFWRLPFGQMAFFICIHLRFVRGVQCLLRMRG